MGENTCVKKNLPVVVMARKDATNDVRSETDRTGRIVNSEAKNRNFMPRPYRRTTSTIKPFKRRLITQRPLRSPVTRTTRRTFMRTTSRRYVTRSTYPYYRYVENDYDDYEDEDDVEEYHFDNDGYGFFDFLFELIFDL